MKRYRVVALCRKNDEPDRRTFSVRVLLSESTAGDEEFAGFTDTHIEEAFEAFRKGWIEIESEIAPKYNRTM